MELLLSRRIAWLWLISLLFLAVPQQVKAVISGCTATVTPTDNEPNVQIQYSVAVTNNDSSNEGRWFRITKPHAGTSLATYTMYPSWYVDTTSDHFTFRYYKNTIASGGTVSPTVTMNIGDIGGETGAWTIEVSDDTGGVNPTACTGSLNFTVTGATDSTPPVINTIVVSEITGTSAVVSWTTNEPSTSVVDYTTVPEEWIYPYQATDATLTTEHSVALTRSLAAGTTYYFRVGSTDASNNTGQSLEYSFTTAETAEATVETVTIESTVTVTETVTNTVTNQVVKTVIEKDTTRPTITLDNKLETLYEEAFTVQGRASDNKGVMRVDYSVDGGTNWTRVEEVTGLGKTTATYSFAVPPLLDGTYELVVRATDSSNNTAKTKLTTFTFDRLPPKMSGATWYLHGFLQAANAAGTLQTVAGEDYTVVLSAIGGATEIKLLIQESRIMNYEEIQMERKGNVWRGTVNLDEPGIYQVMAESLDGAGRREKKALGRLLAVERGQIVDEHSGAEIDGAWVRVYRQGETGPFEEFDGTAWGQTTPVVSDGDGQWAVQLPAGRYYLAFEKDGFFTLRTNLFTLDEVMVVTQDVSLRRRQYIRLGAWEWAWPDVWGGWISLQTSTPEDSRGELVGEELPFFAVTGEPEPLYSSQLRGKPSVLAFVAASVVGRERWLGQLQQLDKLGIRVYPVIVHSSAAQASLLGKQFSAAMPLWSDEQGDVADLLGLPTLPAVLVIDGAGRVAEQAYGMVGPERLAEMVGR